MKKTRKKQIEQIQEKLVALMEKEGANWSKMWVQTMAPFNIKSKKAYRGMNNFWLACCQIDWDRNAEIEKGLEEGTLDLDEDGNILESQGEYENTSPVWGTFKQWNELGHKIKKGSKAQKVVFASKLEKKMSWLTEKQKANVKAGGNMPTYFAWKEFSVFNAVQIEGFDSEKIEKLCGNSKFTKELDTEKVESLRTFIKNTGATILYNETNPFASVDGAYFSPSKDYIGMPLQSKFNDDIGFFGTLLHELVHWTGHKDRLDRDVQHGSSKEDYAKEELVAEIGSAILCQLLGIETTIRANHAQYLNGWIKSIKEDSKVMVQAFSKATKAVDYLYSFQEEMKEEDAA